MIAIDPGISAGLAVFADRTLTACGLERDFAVVTQHTRVVFEKPRAYPHSNVDANNLITLAVSAGRLVERFLADGGVAISIEPRGWKGQVPKTPKVADYIIYRRIVNALDSDEHRIFAQALAQVGSEKAKMDIVDAVGLGLHDLGRL